MIKKKKFEIYTVELEGKSKHYSEAHVKGVEEYFIVTEGIIEVIIGRETINLEKGDAITFVADSEHTYSNFKEIKASGLIVLYYND